VSQQFNQCPTCKRGPIKNIVLAESFSIYECENCETVYCHKFCGSRCPNCASKDAKKIGYVPAG
jgi:hypothetical protein